MVTLTHHEVERMPTYEYRCQACEHEMEATHSIKDSALVECPVCHAPKLERLISSTSFQLKGSGWYKDLYSSKKSESKSTDRSEKVQSKVNESNAKSAEATKSSETTTKSSEPATTKTGGGDKPAA
jgi:putative FmdB family regulatory protein